MIKKIFIILTAFILVSCVWAQNDSNVKINGIEFEIPSKYQGGELENDKYKLEDVFILQCIDNNIPKHIGLWATENDYSANLIIYDHPVRYYCQYNPYMQNNQSHAYFASEDSIYEITWTGNNITKDMEKMIKNTPKPNMSNETFNYILDNSIQTYKKERIDALNEISEYNYLESKYKSKIKNEPADDTRFKEVLLTYYR